MIITKGVTAGEVVTIKLSSGEELIAKLVETSDKAYKICRPLTLVMSSKGLVLQPWLLTVDPDRNITIEKDKVVIIEPTLPEMSKQYIGGTTGLVV
jgi:hypothetical protein